MQLTVLFLRELRAEQYIDDATVLVVAAPHLTAALDRLRCRSRVRHHGNRSAVRRVYRKVK